MAKGFQILELNILRGLDRNKATGDDPDGVPLATGAYNLAPNRRGSLSAFGRNAQHVVDAAPVVVDGSLVGFDERGFASFDTGLNGYRLFDGFRSVDGALTSYSPGTVTDSAHINNFGAYRSRTQFLGYDDADTRKRVEPFNLRPTLSGDEGGTLTEATYGANPFIAVAVDPEGDRWMAVTLGGTTFAADSIDDTFTQRTSVGLTSIRSLTYGDGVWVAAGAIGTRYSTDFGATWSVPATAAVASGEVWKVAWSGSVFVLTYSTGVYSAAIVHSYDGDVWVNSGSLWETPGDPIEEVRGAFSFSESGLGLAITTTNKNASLFQRKTFISENGGVAWFGPGLAFNADKVDSSPVIQLAGGPLTSFWFVNDFGAILFLADGRSPRNETVVWDPAGDTNRYAVAVHYDFVRRKWYAVFADGSFWESENGTTIRRVEELGLDSPPSVDTYAPQLVTSSAEGIMVVGNDGGAGGVRISSGTFGLGSGTYTVYWVTSVSTDAGLVVVDIGSQEFAFSQSFGASIAARLPTLDQIIDDMAWVNQAVPQEVTDAEALLTQRTFVDIYVSYSDVQPGDASQSAEQNPLVDIVPIFAFALRPQSVPVARTIPSNPIGRILGSGDGVMTMGLQAGSAIIHNDRMWAVASKTESLYTTTGDGRTEPEAAKVRGSTVIVYSDIGYVNLMRQGSYLPILPSESDQFVGMVSTPSGILAFFTNEVYLIAGDPALNNIGIELYPDIVGADPGTRPTKMGGVAFCVWQGDIYALSGGQAQAVSKPAYLREDPFIEVVAEPCNRSLIGKTQSGKVFRYFLEHQQWFDNTLQTFDYMLPNPVNCAIGVRYVQASGDVWTVLRDGTPDTPHLVYRSIDYGDKNRVDSTYGMMVPTEGEFDNNNLPRLYFKILENQDDVEDPGSTSFVASHREEGMLRFYIPRGNKARTWDFRLLLRGMGYPDTIEPQLAIEWVEGHTAIRRPGIIGPVV